MTRLKASLGVNSDGKLAESLGLSTSAYANLKKRGSIPFEKVIELAISQKVNLDWLFSGEGGGNMNAPLRVESAVMMPQWENIADLFEGLSEQQRTRIEVIMEEYLALNRLSAEVEALKQQLKASLKDRSNR